MFGKPKNSAKPPQAAPQTSNRTSPLKLEVITSHQTLRAAPNEQAYYILLNPQATADLATSRIPLNLCLLVDRSTSMQGERLYQVKAAINRIINKLQPEDALSLVVFSDRAEVLLPSQREVNLPLVRSLISTIQPNGGTEILPGLEASLKEIKVNQTEDSINHLILLTDGHTYGDEAECLEKAVWAGKNQIHFSAIGLGYDWNEDFLDQLATLSGGASTYIDTSDKVENIFNEIISNLEKAIARKLVMRLDLQEKIYLHEAYQVVPHISRLKVHNNQADLGLLSAEQEKSILLEFRIKPLPPGEQQLMRITVEADIPNQKQGRAWKWVDVKAHISQAPELNINVPAPIKVSLKKLAVFRMQEQVTQDLQTGNVTRATQRLQLMATRLFDLGEANLAQTALFEANQLARTGLLSAGGSKRIRYGTRQLSF